MSELSGRLDGTVHRFPVRVYFEDTDAAGIVYYANYLRFAERARTEMLRLLDCQHSGMMMAEKRIAFAVRSCSTEYLKPARLDDLLEVRTRLFELRGATMRVGQVVAREAAELVRMDLRLACLSLADGRPARLPDSLRKRLSGLCRSNHEKGAAD